jgi:predicted DNA-binding transcriptional regulator YafY
MEIHRHKRLKFIIQTILENKQITFHQLEKKVQQYLINHNENTVGIRALKDDIKYLKTEHKQFRLESFGKDGYRIISKSEENVDELLTNQDLVVLQQLSEIIRQFKFLNHSEVIKNTFRKIIDSETLAKAMLPEVQNVIVFETNSLADDIKEHFDSCLRAILDKKRVILEFKSFEKEVEDRYELSPIQLRQYRHRWYLFAINHSRENKLFNLALDRTCSIELIDKKVIGNELYQVEQHLNNIVGVTNFKNETVKKILLRIDIPRAYYIENKPLHSSQREIKRTALYIEFEYFLAKNNELIADLLALGQDLEVLEPACLRIEIGNLHQNAWLKNK